MTASNDGGYMIMVISKHSNLSFETHFEALIGVSSFLRCCLGALVTIQAVGSLVQFNDSLPAYYLSLRLLDTRIVKFNCLLLITAAISTESKSNQVQIYCMSLVFSCI